MVTGCLFPLIPSFINDIAPTGDSLFNTYKIQIHLLFTGEERKTVDEENVVHCINAFTTASSLYVAQCD